MTNDRHPIRSARRSIPATLLLALCSAAACAAPEPATPGSAADAGWILQALARPAPMRTPFVELRDSKLLKHPLRLSGEYLRPDGDTLVREVRAPYRETTTIRADEVTIARAGGAPRSFSLSRVPELAGLQAGFGAMLGGDRAALERHYAIATEGSRRHWRMTLTPRDAALQQRVQDITLYGRGVELRCIETRPASGSEVQRTLLAGAARRAEAGSAPDDAFAALCRGDGAGG